MLCSCKVWNHLDESIKHLPLKTFKNEVKLNILQSYCSWVFSRSLLFYFFFFILSLLFFFCPFFFLTNNLLCSSFSANLRPIFKPYLLLLSWISFSVILSKCYLFLLIYYVRKLSLTSQFGNKASSCCCSGKCPCYWRRRGSESL